MLFLLTELVEYLLDRYDEKETEHDACKAEMIDVIRIHLLYLLRSSMKREAANLITDIISCLACNPVMVPEPYSLYGCLAWEYSADNKAEIDYIVRHMRHMCKTCAPNENDISRGCGTQYLAALAAFEDL